MLGSDLQKIIRSAIDGNESLFDRFFEDTFKELLPKLILLTKSKDEAQDIFLISMHKFWERFVLKKEELPHNVKGYIYMMCRNVWLRQEKSWNSLKIDNITEVTEKYTIEDDKIFNLSLETEMDEDLLKHQALSIGLEQLSAKCKKIMDTELDPKIKLKDIQEDLGFDNYQALVQAKYNCKKKLIQKVSEIIIDIKQKITF